MLAAWHSKDVCDVVYEAAARAVPGCQPPALIYIVACIDAAFAQPQATTTVAAAAPCYC
jgi:hypothetical protein